MPERIFDNHSLIGRWYEVVVGSSHIGAGRRDHHANYVYAIDVIDALSKAKKMRGWKRTAGFPSIRELFLEEAIEIEEQILKTPGISLNQMKKFGFHGRQENE